MNQIGFHEMPASHVTFHDLKIVHLGHSEDHSNEGFPVKPPFTMEEFTFTSLLSNLSDFDICFDFFIVFHIVFHQLLLPLDLCIFCFLSFVSFSAYDG